MSGTLSRSQARFAYGPGLRVSQFPAAGVVGQMPVAQGAPAPSYAAPAVPVAAAPTATPVSVGGMTIGPAEGSNVTGDQIGSDREGGLYGLGAQPGNLSGMGLSALGGLGWGSAIGGLAGLAMGGPLGGLVGFGLGALSDGIGGAGGAGPGDMAAQQSDNANDLAPSTDPMAAVDVGSYGDGKDGSFAGEPGGLGSDGGAVGENTSGGGDSKGDTAGTGNDGPGFMRGGYTGHGGDGVMQPAQKAGIVHEGEIVIPAAQVARYGLRPLMALVQGQVSPSRLADLARG